MAFGVATNNRFNLFVDEDEEPDDLLTKQQRQVADERQRKDSERRSAAKLKTGGEHAPGTGQTPLTTVKPSSNNAAAVTVAPSSGNERPEFLRDARRLSGSSRHGRGIGRGSSVPASDDGFDRFGKREFDRHSGSSKTGLKPVEKRSGGGAHNWGNIADTVRSFTEDEETGTTLNITKVGSARGEDGGDIEETVHQLTLDEWRALKTDRQPTSSGFNIRRPGEGCTSDPAWTGMHVLKKKDDVDVVGRSGKFDDADEEVGRSQKPVVQIPVRFSDADSHAGRGRGRGNTSQQPQQRVSPRQHHQPTSADDLVPNVDSEQDFPSLS